MSLLRYQTNRFPAWSSFRRLSNLQDSLFHLSLPFEAAQDRLFSGWNPALDVYQDKDQVFVKCELPGLKKEEIAISLQENVLSISGERKNEHETKESGDGRSERFFGRFHRSVTLPTPVKATASRPSTRMES